jgi:hypothetical protein
MFLWKTLLQYNPNLTIRKKIKLQGEKKDTVEVEYFDTLGISTNTTQNISGLRTTKILYEWNKDKTEMKELHYENDTSVFTTIIHRYKNNKEYERIDPSTSPKPFYWIYDNKGRVIETNEGLYYIVYFTYNQNDRIATKTVNVLFSDSNEKDLPKKFHFKYDYTSRN